MPDDIKNLGHGSCALPSESIDSHIVLASDIKTLEALSMSNNLNLVTAIEAHTKSIKILSDRMRFMRIALDDLAEEFDANGEKMLKLKRELDNIKLKIPWYRKLGWFVYG